MAYRQRDKGPPPGPVTIYDGRNRPLERRDPTTGARVLLVSRYVIAGRKGGQKGGQAGGQARWQDIDKADRSAAMSRLARQRWSKVSGEGRRQFALKMVEARRKSPRMSREEMKRARTDLGLTQKELSAECGVHPITVARWEAGVRGISERAAARVQHLLSKRQKTSRRVIKRTTT